MRDELTRNDRVDEMEEPVKRARELQDKLQGTEPKQSD